MNTVVHLPIIVAPSPVAQRSEEWFAQRLGKFTGSQFASLMAGESTESYQGYLREKAWERLTGRAVQGYTNDAMQHGIDTEPQARAYYEFVNYTDVQESGFVIHQEYDFLGVSPDGFVGTDGLIEIKCPQPKTHIEYLATKKMPSKYRWQIQGQLLVTGRSWCDFVSFHPDCEHQLICRIQANKDDHEKLIERALVANEAVNKLIDNIKESA